MSFIGYLSCSCGAADCDAVTLVDDIHTDEQARRVAQDRGWTRDVIGGNTIDLAPGHTWERAA